MAVGARDRERLERLLRYAARPALALDRLSRLPDGRLAYRLKRMWSNDETDVVFEPQDFLARLAALVPAPRVHLTRFHGILAPAAAWRSLVVPKPVDEPDVSLWAVTPVAERSPSKRVTVACFHLVGNHSLGWPHGDEVYLFFIGQTPQSV